MPKYRKLYATCSLRIWYVKLQVGIHLLKADHDDKLMGRY